MTRPTPFLRRAETDVVDVAIVGYGPVGAALAILLAQRGWRVVVLERWAEPYPLPRAVHFDHEAGRILQSCGIGEALSKISEPGDTYEFQNAARQPLVRFGRVGNGLSGWPQSSMFSQPDLEACCTRASASCPDRTCAAGVRSPRDDAGGRRGRARRTVDSAGGKGGLRTASSGEGAGFRARMRRCDGANSTVANCGVV